MANNVRIMSKGNHISEGKGYRYALDVYDNYRRSQKGHTSMVIDTVEAMEALLLAMSEVEHEEMRKQA